jgi:hypothetical protein
MADLPTSGLRRCRAGVLNNLTTPKFLRIPLAPFETLARSSDASAFEGVALCASSQPGKSSRHCGYCGYFGKGIICFDFLLLAIYLNFVSHMYLGECFY